MIIPCEVAVKSVIPAVKALIAKELLEKQNLKQNEVAEILGISQSAVSKYNRKVRGYVIRIDNLKEIRPLIDDMTELISNGVYQRPEFLKLFCKICATIRKNNLMCPFCQKTDENIKVEECNFCST